MAMDPYSRRLLAKEWDNIRLPILKKLNELHADVAIVCEDRSRMFDEEEAKTSLYAKEAE